MTESAIVNKWMGPTWDQAKLETVREDLIEVLQCRFPDQMNDEIIQSVNSQKVLATLRSWLRDASLSPSWDVFIKRLRRG